MGRINVSVEIDAPTKRVWDFIEPIETHVDWMADADAIRFDSPTQTRGIGTSFVCDTTIGPIRLRDRMVVTEWEAGVQMGIRHTGAVTGDGLFELSSIDLDRRTRFSWTEQIDFPWYLGGPFVLWAIGAPILKRVWNRNMSNLKDLIELSA
jgi:hypothetical protein